MLQRHTPATNAMTDRLPASLLVLVLITSPTGAERTGA